MLTITTIVGNIFHDKELMNKFKQMESQKKCERMKILRHELERGRIRKTTDLGTDIGLILNSQLYHGDVIMADQEKFVIVEQLPEKVISIKIKNLKDNPVNLVTLGHIIGNRHKPIMINDDTLSFPIHVDSEVEVFKKLFSGIMHDFEFMVEEQIFQPQRGMYIHEH
ncbi:MAG TPA: Urease accessory protein [Candidatus Nitrosotalea sp.]|nr:Urease accessory protein [Nitrososphaerota archaeon]HKU32736.1 Urease accessory protein [Candidatus Nitrosotalea sp.]